MLIALVGAMASTFRKVLLRVYIRNMIAMDSQFRITNFETLSPLLIKHKQVSSPMLPFTFTQNNCFGGQGSSLRKKMNCNGSTGFRSKLKSRANTLCMNDL